MMKWVRVSLFAVRELFVLTRGNEPHMNQSFHEDWPGHNS